MCTDPLDAGLGIVSLKLKKDNMNFKEQEVTGKILNMMDKFTQRLQLIIN